MTFGEAIKHIENGGAAHREGWNGKGMFIKMQKPEDKAFMTLPYIYLDTPDFTKPLPEARNRVPWLASQTDMFAKDWVLI